MKKKQKDSYVVRNGEPFPGINLFAWTENGLCKNNSMAEKFIKVLRFLGKNKNENYSMKIVTKGKKENNNIKRIVEMNGPEEILTAIVPAIICEQIAEETISKPGAFTGPEIVDIPKFVDTLKEKDIGYRDSIVNDE